MSTYYYIVNLDKNEYLECPVTCGVKLACYLEKKMCVKDVLCYLLLDDWQGDKIGLLPTHQIEDLPVTLKDVTIKYLRDLVYADAPLFVKPLDEAHRDALCPSKSMCIRTKKCVCE